MTKKPPAFSMIELIIVLAIIAILATIAIPSYQTHMNKIKLADIFTFMSYHKIHVASALLNQESIDKNLENPTNLIAQLTIQFNNTNANYIIQAKVNTNKINLKHPENKPLLINFIATLKEDLLGWNCQVQTGYKLNLPQDCSPMELSLLPTS